MRAQCIGQDEAPAVSLWMTLSWVGDSSAGGREALQEDADRLEGWAEARAVRFNKVKFCILFLGHNDPVFCYRHLCNSCICLFMV